MGLRPISKYPKSKQPLGFTQFYKYLNFISSPHSAVNREPSSSILINYQFLGINLFIIISIFTLVSISDEIIQFVILALWLLVKKIMGNYLLWDALFLLSFLICICLLMFCFWSMDLWCYLILRYLSETSLEDLRRI